MIQRCKQHWRIWSNRSTWSMSYKSPWITFICLLWKAILLWELNTTILSHVWLFNAASTRWTTNPAESLPHVIKHLFFSDFPSIIWNRFLTYIGLSKRLEKFLKTPWIWGQASQELLESVSLISKRNPSINKMHPIVSSRFLPGAIACIFLILNSKYNLLVIKINNTNNTTPRNSCVASIALFFLIVLTWFIWLQWTLIGENMRRYWIRYFLEEMVQLWKDQRNTMNFGVIRRSQFFSKLEIKFSRF